MSAAAVPGTVPGGEPSVTRRSGRARSLLRHPAGVAGGVVTLVLLLAAVAGAAGLTPYDPAAQDVSASLQSPDAAHWFGTDRFGRDVLSRVMQGLGSSLRVAAVSVLLSGVVGVLLGTCAGFLGGWLDRVVGALANVLFAFPSLLLALALTVALDRTWVTVAIAIAVVYVPIFVRVSRGPVLTLRSADYVTAAAAMGRSRLAVLAEHVLPAISGLLVVQVALTLSWSVLTEASLSFLGFGTPPPDASLGLMVFEAQTLVSIAPWLLVFPGLAVVVLVAGLTMLGDGLRAALDPRGRRR